MLGDVEETCSLYKINVLIKEIKSKSIIYQSEHQRPLSEHFWDSNMSTQKNLC